jgi:hypothetical protein
MLKICGINGPNGDLEGQPALDGEEYYEDNCPYQHELTRQRIARGYISV